ncbi:MAG: hypothetical protein HRT57_02885 [Crocinitomicaceae bacterium]|nr:hypothetical protein [Crocinitomicaceae bacterium]
MKNCIVILSFLSVCQFAFGTLTVDGIYQGKNLYIQNPMTEEGGYCIDSVYINEIKYDQDLVAGAFEIDFKSLNFKVSDSIHMVIYHQDGCKPKILNTNLCMPITVSPVAKFEAKNDTLWLETKNFNYSALFLEVYRYNKWVVLDTIIKSQNLNRSYPFISISHSGNNQFRIKYTGAMGVPLVSRDIYYESSLPKVNFEVDGHAQFVTFSSPTNYEVYTVMGNLVTSGYGSSIDLSVFSKEECDNNDQLFYLNLDNRNEKLKVHHHH